MGVLRDCYITGAFIISILLIGLSILCGLKAGYYETSRHCSMSWSRPQYTEITQLTNINSTEIQSIYPSSYKMYYHFQETHRFVQQNMQLHKDKNNANPRKSNIDTIIIYIPGQSGSYLQIRSIASRYLQDKYLLLPQDQSNPQNNNHHENTLFLTFNFGNEWSSISPAIISRQTAFVYTMITEYLCYDETLQICDIDSDDVDIIFIGHSMGGIVTSSLINILSKKPIQSASITPIDQYNHNILSKVKGVILISTPIHKPLMVFENKFKNFYQFHSMKFKEITQRNNIVVLSLSGGLEDFLIESYLSQISVSDTTDFIVSDLCPSIMNTMDHQATVWCHATTETVARYILGILNGERRRNKYLYPFVPTLKYNQNKKGYTLNQVFGTKMRLNTKDVDNIDDSIIVVSCSYPIKDLTLCSSSDNCIDITKYMHTVSSWISHQNNKFNFSLNHENHAFIQKFIAVINGRDISLKKNKEQYLKIRGSAFNPKRERCSLWHGYIDTVDHSKHNEIKNKSINHYMNYNLKSNGVHVDTLRLSPLMIHDIKITVIPPPMDKETRNDYICVSGWSGMINSAGNGVYINKSASDTEQYYEQEQSYWYSPTLKLNRFGDKQFPALYLYKYPGAAQGGDTKPWVFGSHVGDSNVNSVCEKTNGKDTPLDCKEWKILEFNVNDRGSRNGFNGWRNGGLLSVTDECSPYDVSLLHLSLDGASSALYNQWVSLSSIHGETVHRMMVPRVNNELLMKDMNNTLSFVWYLFDKESAEREEWIMDIEYNYLSSLINTIIRDFDYFPFVIIMCIWFGLIANMYNVVGVDLINFYMMIQCILMAVAILDILPLSAHWRYIYLSYKQNEINSANYKIYLLEFMLPFIYYSGCAVLLYSIYKVLVTVFRDILFRFIELIHVNDLFVIPWGLLEYTVYLIVIIYCVCGYIVDDLNVLIKKQLIVNDIDIEIHHLIVVVLLFVSICNLIRSITKSSSSLFSFYEKLLFIFVIFSRWGLLFGVLENQQYFELIVIVICSAIVSYFEINDITKYQDNFHSKALLSFCNQIYIMQKNIHKDVLGQTFVLTPLLQSIICWSICKIIIKKFL